MKFNLTCLCFSLLSLTSINSSSNHGLHLLMAPSTVKSLLREGTHPSVQGQNNPSHNNNDIPKLKFDSNHHHQRHHKHLEEPNKFVEMRLMMALPQPRLKFQTRHIPPPNTAKPSVSLLPHSPDHKIHSPTKPRPKVGLQSSTGEPTKPRATQNVKWLGTHFHKPTANHPHIFTKTHNPHSHARKNSTPITDPQMASS